MECFLPQFCWLTKINLNKCSSVMRENDQNMPVLLRMTFRTPFSGPKNHFLEHNLIAFFVPSKPFTPHFVGQQKKPQPNIKKGIFQTRGNAKNNHFSSKKWFFGPLSRVKKTYFRTPFLREFFSYHSLHTLFWWEAKNFIKKYTEGRFVNKPKRQKISHFEWKNDLWPFYGVKKS